MCFLKKKLIKICPTEFNNESRDIRELLVCKELGMNICVIAKNTGKDIKQEEIIGDFRIIRCTTKPLGEEYFHIINRCCAFFLWVKAVRKESPDIISGHDLLGITIGWVSTWFQPPQKKAKLVYDAHEFEIGRNAKRSKLGRFAIKIIEKSLIKKCAFSIMVNESIVNEVATLYNLKKRPIVIRSIPEKWNLNYEKIKGTRKYFENYFGINKKILMYHGTICRGRGIELLIESLNICPSDIVLIILGNAQNITYINKLKEKISIYNLNDRILFLSAVSIKKLPYYIAAVDLEMILIEPICRSYYYALPNKLFESIQALTPIIASDLPEIRQIVESYKIGAICKSYNAIDIRDCIVEFFSSLDNNKTLKENLNKAKQELCWEYEKETLTCAYKKLLSI